jgi:hypothetical protein
MEADGGAGLQPKAPIPIETPSAAAALNDWLSDATAPTPKEASPLRRRGSTTLQSTPSTALISVVLPWTATPSGLRASGQAAVAHRVQGSEQSQPPAWSRHGSQMAELPLSAELSEGVLTMAAVEVEAERAAYCKRRAAAASALAEWMAGEWDDRSHDPLVASLSRHYWPSGLNGSAAEGRELRTSDAGYQYVGHTAMGQWALELLAEADPETGTAEELAVRQIG